MKQIYNLIKKDIILIRKNLVMMILVLCFALIPIAKETPGSLLYGALVSIITLMVYNMISMEEVNQKGHIYMAATPISNTNIGLSKILTIIITFVIVTTSYIGLSSFGLDKFGRISLLDIVIAFFFVGVFFLIYIPLTFKIGYVRLQMLSFLVIFLTPLIMSFFIKNTRILVKIKNYILNFSAPSLVSFSLIFCLALIGVTGIVSGNILANKEY